jgi:pimeloyl-ACP methyl ester carboxylesterase
MNAEFWKPQIEAFAASRHVIAYDMLGHGGSPLPPDPAKLEHYLDQLLALMDALGLEQADLVGHSMGAIVVLGFALQHPERVTRVAALNGVYQRNEVQRAAVQDRVARLERGEGGAGNHATIARWFGDPVPPLLQGTTAWVDQALTSVSSTGYARTYRLFAEADRAFSGRLSGLAMPALFATGALDPNSTPAMSQAMAAQAPQGEAVVLPGERHMMSLVSPAAVNAMLTDFLGIKPALAR